MGLKNIEKRHNPVVKHKIRNKDSKPMWLLFSEILTVSEGKDFVRYRSDITVSKKEVESIYNYIFELESRLKEAESSLTWIREINYSNENVKIANICHEYFENRGER